MHQVAALDVDVWQAGAAIAQRLSTAWWVVGRGYLHRTSISLTLSLPAAGYSPMLSALS